MARSHRHFCVDPWMTWCTWTGLLGTAYAEWQAKTPTLKCLILREYALEPLNPQGLGMQVPKELWLMADYLLRHEGLNVSGANMVDTWPQVQSALLYRQRCSLFLGATTKLNACWTVWTRACACLKVHQW